MALPPDDPVARLCPKLATQPTTLADWLSFRQTFTYAIRINSNVNGHHISVVVPLMVGLNFVATILFFVPLVWRKSNTPGSGSGWRPFEADHGGYIRPEVSKTRPVFQLVYSIGAPSSALIRRETGADNTVKRLLSRRRFRKRCWTMADQEVTL